MYGFLIVIHVLACVFLIAVILFQAGRGGGLSETFGGGAMQSMFGSKSADVMTKITAAGAIVFLSTSLLLTILSARRGKSLMQLEASKVKQAVEEVVKEAEKTKAETLPQTTDVPGAQPVTEEAAKTVTVREVKIDPQTGEEIVVKEEKLTPEEAEARK